MMQEYFVPYDEDKYLAAQLALHRQGFAVIESDEIVLAFQSCSEAVVARCWLGSFMAPEDSEMATDEAFRLFDNPGLPAAIAGMEAGLSLRATSCRALMVDVNSSKDDVLVWTITDAFWI